LTFVILQNTEQELRAFLLKFPCSALCGIFNVLQ